MVVNSIQQYEDRAVQLANSLKYTPDRVGSGELYELRRKLFMSREDSALFDTLQWTRNAEVRSVGLLAELSADAFNLNRMHTKRSGAAGRKEQNLKTLQNGRTASDQRRSLVVSIYRRAGTKTKYT